MYTCVCVCVVRHKYNQQSGAEHIVTLDFWQ